MTGIEARKTRKTAAILETVVPGRTSGELDVELKLHSPGQRGILQSLVEAKTCGVHLLPKYASVIKHGRPLVQQHSAKKASLGVLVKLLQKSDGHLVRHRLLMSQAPPAAKTTKTRGATRKTKRSADVAAEANAMEIEDSAGVHLEKATLYLEKATNVCRMLMDDDDKYTANAEALQEQLSRTEQLASQFEEELKRIDTVTDAWMSVKWTADNTTAMGRGPPGHIAFNPFSQFQIPYDAADVARIIEESNKRTR